MARNNCPYCDSAYTLCPGHPELNPPQPAESVDAGVKAYPLWKAIHAASERAGHPCSVGLAQVIDALSLIDPAGGAKCECNLMRTCKACKENAERFNA